METVNFVEPEDSFLFAYLTDEQKQAVKQLREFTERKLEKVDRTLFFHYTAHDIKHSLRTLYNVCIILEKTKIKDELSPEDALILLCACIIHDIGMGPVDDDEEVWMFKNSGKRDDERVDTKIKKWRYEHHNRTRDWVLNRENELFSFSDTHVGLRDAIANVARGHREVSLLSDEYFIDKPNLATLAAVLRLGDQMDLSPERLRERFDIDQSEYVIRQLINSVEHEDDEIQIREALKSLTTKRWTLSQSTQDEKILVLETDIEYSPDIALVLLAALEHLVGDIEKSIEETKLVNDALPVKVILQPLLNTVLDEHQLRANYRVIWRYLSESVYPPSIRHIAPIREAITNAVDACLVLNDEDRKNVLVKVRDNNDHLIIEDNGIGMSRNIISNYLMVLGSSYYTSRRFSGVLKRESRPKPPLISTFGIGSFSYLLISGGYKLDTFDGIESTHVVFSNSFAIASQSTKNQKGTKVIIPFPHLFRGYSIPTSESLLFQIEKLFVRPKIPIEFTGTDGKVKVLSPPERMKKEDYTQSAVISTTISDNMELNVFCEVDLDFGISFHQSNVDITFESYWFYRINEITHLLENDRKQASKYNLLYAGMHLSEQEKPLIPHLWGLYNTSHPYYCPGEVMHEKHEIQNHHFDVTLDFEPNSIKVGITKTYLEFEFERPVSNICFQVDGICRKIVKEILEADTTPWQIADRMRQAILSAMVIEGLSGDYIHSFSMKYIQKQVIDILTIHRKYDLKDLIGKLLVVDAKSENVIQVSDVSSKIKINKLVIANVQTEPTNIFLKEDMKDWLEHVTKGVKKTLNMRIKTPEIIVLINGGRTISPLIKWYLEKEGISDIELLDSKGSRNLQHPDTWNIHDPPV